MKNNIITLNGKTWKQVQKRTAKKIYEEGKDVYFIPCKMNSNSPCSLGMIQNRDLWGQYRTFEQLCENYWVYNCNHETGLYPHFYIEI